MEKSFTAKLKIIMKWCAVQWMIATTLSGLAIAHTNYAQLLENRITISLSEVPLDRALREIADKSQVKFAYSVDQLGQQENITMQAYKKPLGEVLESLLTPRNINYTVHEKERVITLKKQKVKNEEANRGNERINIYPPLSMIPVSGIVTDANQQPMVGVNIVVRGSTNGTTTGADGRFTLNVEKGEILVFSFIGYASVEIKMNDQTVIEVALQEDTQSLNEVVVNAGYWKVRDREQTGNIAKISAEEIARQPVNNPLQALQGRMPGVYIQQSSGVPGSGFNIQIRGRNSLRADGNAPLYIVDGVPYNGTALGSIFSNSIVNGGSPLNQLNPADIESIEILKDADATAIYGSRGANGVVLITTKKGSSGKTKLDINIYSGAGKVAQRMDLLNTEQYLEMRKEAFQNDNLTPGLSNAPDLMNWDTNRYTDWQKKLIGGTANLTSAQVSLSGGDNRTQFSWGGGYLRESTVFPGDFNDQKISSHLNLSHNSADQKLHLNMSVSYLMDQNRLLYQDLTNQALTLSPNAPEAFDENGNLNWDVGFQNPYSSTLQTFKSDTYNLITNATVDYEIAKGLHLKSNMGFNTVSMKENVFFPISAFNPAYGISSGNATFGNRSVNTWIVEPQIEYQVQLGSGKLTTLVGGTFQQTLRDGQTTYGYGFASDALLENLQAATGSSILFSENSKYRYNALFGRINYSYKNKYLLNLTARRDGSSRFGIDKRFANFGAVGAAWIFSEEAFLENATWLSFGKVRGSIGTTGSDQVGEYQYLETYRATSYSYQGKSGLYPTRLANADYGWEQSRKTEGGIELGFFRDKIRTSVSYYNNRSTDQLVGYPLSATTGFPSVQYNLPATVRNSGWEFTGEVSPLQGVNWEWDVSANITIPQNKLIEFPNLEGSSYANTYEVGKSLFTQKRFHYVGVDNQTGVYQFQDVDSNGTGTDFPADLQALKKLTQKYYGGINNRLKYKSFELNIFLQIVKQTGLGYFTGFQVPGSLKNQPIWVTSRWQKPGDVTDVQLYTTGIGLAGSAYNQIPNYGDNNIVDASFIRLKNISLAWELPGKWMAKTKLTKSRLYIQGQNIFTSTHYKGLDPETQSYTRLPPLRMITGGIQITL